MYTHFCSDNIHVPEHQTISVCQDKVHYSNLRDMRCHTMHKQPQFPGWLNTGLSSNLTPKPTRVLSTKKLLVFCTIGKHSPFPCRVEFLLLDRSLQQDPLPQYWRSHTGWEKKKTPKPDSNSHYWSSTLLKWYPSHNTQQWKCCALLSDWNSWRIISVEIHCCR